MTPEELAGAKDFENWMKQEEKDREILDDATNYEDQIDRRSNEQCYFCGGWAIFCPCDTNREIKRYIELTTKEIKKIKKPDFVFKRSGQLS